MRIYSSEILAAVAFIASLPRYCASGSETGRPNLRTSVHPKDREIAASDDRTSRSNDEEDVEDRTWTWSVQNLLELIRPAEEQLHGVNVPGLAAQGLDHVTSGGAKEQIHDHHVPFLDAESWHQLTHAYEGPELLGSSGTVKTPVLDLTSVAGKEKAPVVAPRSDADSTGITEYAPVVAPTIEQLKAGKGPHFLSTEKWNRLKNDRRWEPSAQAMELQRICDYHNTGFAVFVFAVWEAKAYGFIEDDRLMFLQMLEGWKKDGVQLDDAFDRLDLYDVETVGYLTELKLNLLQLYLQVLKRGVRGGRINVYRYIRLKLNGDADHRYLRTIVQAGEMSTIADGMLMHLVAHLISGRVSSCTIIYRLCIAQISESMVRRLLSKILKASPLRYSEKWDDLTKALKTTLEGKWEIAVKAAMADYKKTKKLSVSRTTSGWRRFWRRMTPPAPKERAPKRQKVAEPPIRH